MEKLRVGHFFTFLFVMLLLVASVVQAGANDYLIQIGSPAHQKFGLYYPVTYRFRIPENVRPFSVNYRYSSSESWKALPERTAADTFNGIQAVRFDYGANLAYVSISFSRSSDEIYLRMLDRTGQPVEFTFDSIPNYYDGRSGAVTISLDDYADWSASSFDTALQYLDSYGMQPTVAVIAGQVRNWGLLQQMINKYGEKVEVASHGVTHLCNAGDYLYFGYQAEVAGSRDMIRSQLSFPAHPYIPVYVEPCGYSDTTLQSWVSASDYLAPRSVLRGGSFAAWDPGEGRYGRAVISFDDYNYTDEQNLLLDANAAFDQALAGGNIYHLLNHPATGLWHATSYLLQHLNHIMGRNDVWYVPLGNLYQYHFIQERRGGLAITSHDSTPGQPPPNRIPVAEAGSNQVVPQGTKVTLDGSRSYDPDNDSLAYIWKQLQGPAVTLWGDKTAYPVFTAPETDMPLLFQLEVSDGKAVSGPDTVRIEAVPAMRTISASGIGNGSIACTPGTVVSNRTQVTCSVIANPNNHISEVTIDGARQSVPNPTTFSYSFGAVTADHSIVARFALDTYSLLFRAAEGGSVAGPASQNVSHGQSSAAVTALPEKGYHFLRWSAADGFTSTANPLTISNVTATRTITANFAVDTFLVEFVSGGNGSISGPASQTIGYGSPAAAVAAVPAEGYQFREWTGGGGFRSTANPLIISGVTGNGKFTANFSVETFTVEFVSGGNGSITGVSSQTVGYGASAAAVTAVPAEGFRFTNWTAPGGFTSSANPLVLGNIRESRTITANFAADSFEVRFISGGNGTITGAADQWVTYGGSATAVAAVPAEGYHFVRWMSAGGFSSYDNPLIIGGVTGSQTFTAQFSRDIHTVTPGS